ncbi:2',3'-cyclic-nucleotide 3'-phosphodiesterase, partial [Phenoliferia sp. Uapishka_3]
MKMVESDGWWCGASDWNGFELAGSGASDCEGGGSGCRNSGNKVKAEEAVVGVGGVNVVRNDGSTSQGQTAPSSPRGIKSWASIFEDTASDSLQLLVGGGSRRWRARMLERARRPNLTLNCYLMATFSGYALWLIPPATSLASTSLSSLINSLASTHSTPQFAPHVTLLTGFSFDPSTTLSQFSQAIKSASLSSPLRLDFDGLGTKTTPTQRNYFQYLFAVINPENEELMKLRKAVREALLTEEQLGVADDYFPHLSLMYGDDTESRNVGRIIEGLEKREVKRGRASGWEINGVEVVEVEEVLLVRCEGPPEDWEVIGRLAI